MPQSGLLIVEEMKMLQRRVQSSQVTAHQHLREARNTTIKTANILSNREADRKRHNALSVPFQSTAKPSAEANAAAATAAAATAGAATAAAAAAAVSLHIISPEVSGESLGVETQEK